MHEAVDLPGFGLDIGAQLTALEVLPGCSLMRNEKTGD
jgi:hypothetical protein